MIKEELEKLLDGDEKISYLYNIHIVESDTDDVYMIVEEEMEKEKTEEGHTPLTKGVFAANYMAKIMVSTLQEAMAYYFHTEEGNKDLNKLFKEMNKIKDDKPKLRIVK